MGALPRVRRAFAEVARTLRDLNQAFALVGGLGVGMRTEVRFTKDVDFAVSVADDDEAESLIFELQSASYGVKATIEHDRLARLSTARLRSPGGVIVDLLFAACGIEPEIVERATAVRFAGVGLVRLARPEELVAMKLLSAKESRLIDHSDISMLLQFHPNLDRDVVRDNLLLIEERGFAGDLDLQARFDHALATYLPVPGGADH